MKSLPPKREALVENRKHSTRYERWYQGSKTHTRRAERSQTQLEQTIPGVGWHLGNARENWARRLTGPRTNRATSGLCSSLQE